MTELPQGQNVARVEPKLRPGKTRAKQIGWKAMTVTRRGVVNASCIARNKAKWCKWSEWRAAKLLRTATSTEPEAELSPFSSLESLLSTLDTHGNPECLPERPSRPSSPRSPKSPTSLIKSLLSLTPTKRKSIADFFLGGKRATPDEPDSPTSIVKKMKLKTTAEEVEREPGAVRSASDIHTELLMLARYEQYVPLHLFTAKNRRYIWMEGDSIPKKKLGQRAHEKSVYVMDVSLPIFGREEDLEEADWRDASHFYLTFMTKIGNEDFLQRWTNHFDYFITQPDVKRNFPAYLRSDIKLRKQYHGQPFAFSRPLYVEDVRESKEEIADEEKIKAAESAAREKAQREARELREAADRRRYDSSQSSGSRSRPGQSSFRNDGSGRETTCLICARKGHRLQACTFGTFEDGKPTFAVLADKGMRPRAGAVTDAICIGWNIIAAAIKKCTHPSTSTLLHVCSFCGSADHHAFAWRCKSRPT